MRTYDRQTVLMGVIKPGIYTGEITLLLDIPWLATVARRQTGQIVPAAARRISGGCWAPAIRWRGRFFNPPPNKMRNLEGYSQQREKLASLGTMAAGLAHELNNPAAAARRAAAHLQETTDKAQALLCQLSKPAQA